tara:strand:- start:71 stop:604 length:534 start_codon:yes stop_codon:yes gene_type:complete
LNYKNFFHKCSQQDLCKIFFVKKIEDIEIHEIIKKLQYLGPNAKQAEYNKELKKYFSSAGWVEEVKVSKNKHIGMKCDFYKTFNNNQVFLEIQFGKTEAILKDVCKMQIAYDEQSLDLGIVIVPLDPNQMFSERKKSISGMAYFTMVKHVLPYLHFKYPMWVIGLNPNNYTNNLKQY